MSKTLVNIFEITKKLAKFAIRQPKAEALDIMYHMTFQSEIIFLISLKFREHQTISKNNINRKTVIIFSCTL